MYFLLVMPQRDENILSSVIFAVALQFLI